MSIDTDGPPPPDGGHIADRRKAFERATRKSGRDEEAERAFIEGKMALVRSHPTLSEEEKEKALAELRLELEKPRSQLLTVRAPICFVTRRGRSQLPA